MIIAVTGGKGGVGKSTVSLNLGRELDAVVVDADLSTADLPRGRGPDLHDVLAGRANPTDAIERIDSVRVLPCGRTLAGARASDLSQLPAVVERIEREHGRVVIDCPAGLARDVGVQLASADVAVLVTTPSEAAVTDASRTAQLARDLDTPIVAVVLNRAKSTSESAEFAQRVERTFTTPTTVIEERTAVAVAQEQRRPVRDRFQKCPAVESFEAVARTVRRYEIRVGRVRSS